MTSFHDVTTWFTNNCNIYIAECLTKKGNQSIKFGTLIEIFFFKNYAENEAGRLVPDLFLFLKKPSMR